MHSQVSTVGRIVQLEVDAFQACQQLHIPGVSEDLVRRALIEIFHRVGLSLNISPGPAHVEITEASNTLMKGSTYSVKQYLGQKYTTPVGCIRKLAVTFDYYSRMLDNFVQVYVYCGNMTKDFHYQQLLSHVITSTLVEFAVIMGYDRPLILKIDQEAHKIFTRWLVEVANSNLQ